MLHPSHLPITICESMLPLREVRKHYVRAPGSGHLVNGDALAAVFAELTVEQIILVCMQILALERNPYEHLNRGQQSMNLRNIIRGAIRREDITVEEVAKVRDAIVSVFH